MRRKFALTGIDRYFDALASSHDYGACKEAAGFWSAFTAEHAIDSTSAFLLDDNHAVLRAARAFGIASVYGVQYPDSLGERKTSDEFHCIGSFDELWDDSKGELEHSAGC
jgi:putative hydrolase of the HAD superfamily